MLIYWLCMLIWTFNIPLSSTLPYLTSYASMMVVYFYLSLDALYDKRYNLLREHNTTEPEFIWFPKIFRGRLFWLNWHVILKESATFHYPDDTNEIVWIQTDII